MHVLFIAIITHAYEYVTYVHKSNNNIECRVNQDWGNQHFIGEAGI